MENEDLFKLLKKYPVFQLKRILKEIKSKEKLNIKLSKLIKKDVIYYLIKNQQYITNLPDIEKLPKRLANILKRFNTQPYNAQQQEEFLSKGYQVKAPLKAKSEYLNQKTNKQEKITLLDHQSKFLRKFFLSNVSGCIVFHGVGSGKTLTSVVASHYYLSLYPEGNIIVISPPALIVNFVNGLKQYGLNIEDNRYSFKSFEQFARNPTIKNPKTLLIVDEAHILRTQIQVHESEDKNHNKIINVSQNKRGYAVLEACKKCDKVILLTGTPFINKLYDIENLLSMVDKKNPLNPDSFYLMITNTSSRNDYFNYKISHYENQSGDEYFPEKIEEYVPLLMTEEEQNLYERFDRGDTSVVEEEGIDIHLNVNNEKSLTSFYNGTRQYSDTIGHKKIDFIIDRINKPKTTGKFIIYTTFITNGLKSLQKALNNNHITYSTISGNESSEKKEDAKDKYNKGDVQVLLITKAGTEGIDTIGTEGIFIYEGSQWNEPLVSQAIARAIRYKSHYHLPKDQQKVWVYRLLIVKSTDVSLINKINEHKIFNFGIINKKFILQSKQISELKSSADEGDDSLSYIGNNNKLPENMGVGMKKTIDFKREEYKKLSPQEKEEYLKKIKFNRYEADNKINELFKQRPSVEARLTVMALAKQEQILEFIKELDNNIQQLEDYETPYEAEVNEIVLENLSDETILQIQKRYIEEQTQDIFKLIKSDGRLSEILQKATDRAMKAKKKLDSVKCYQAFYTPAPLVKKNVKNEQVIKIIQ